MVIYKPKHKHMVTSTSDRLFYIINGALLIILFIIIGYPLVYVVSSSFSSASDVAAGRVKLWPVNLSLEGYAEVLSYKKIYTGFYNTMYYAIVGTISGVIATCLCGFPLSRRNLYGKKFLVLLFVVPMYFTGGLIPTYLLINKIGLYNTRGAVIIPPMLSMFNVLLAKTYFTANVPEELYESSQLDGCSDFRFFISTVLPLSKTIIAVLILYIAIHYWNDFYQSFVFLTDSKLYPLQLVLREILLVSQNLANMEVHGLVSPEELTKVGNMYELLKYCVIVVASLPIICFYPFIQRYFVKGVMIGSLKG